MNEVAELSAAVDAVCGLDAAALADSETLQLLHRALAQLEAATTRAATAFDASREWEAHGSRSAAAWLAVRCRQPVATCRRRVRLGRNLRHLPAAEAAWLVGDIGEAHVSLLAEARTPATVDVFTRDEAMLVDQAKQLTFRQFQRVLAYWRQFADPDGVEVDAAARHAARRLHLSQSVDGTWFLDARLDPLAGAAVSDVLRRLEDELFEADWADAKSRIGDGVAAADLARSPAQRRADALVEMARRAAAAPPGARRPEPLFTVLVGYETFAGRVCELADGTVVTPGSLVGWLSEGWVERIVFDGPDRVVNVGVRRRLFTGATRRAVEVIGRTCFHEFCDVPAGETQIDHIQPYAAGGATSIENGRPACGHHNRARHRRSEPP